MQKILAQIPHHIDAAFALSVTSADKFANLLRWVFGAIFAVAFLWSWNDSGAIKMIYLGMALVWMFVALVFGREPKTNSLGSANLLLYFDLAIISLGLLGCAWQGLLINKGAIIFLCYFPVLAMVARRNNILLLARVVIFIIVFYTILSLVAIGSFPLLRGLLIAAMGFAAFAVTRKPKKELVNGASEAVREAYELGAKEKATELTALVHEHLMPPVQYHLPGLYVTYKHAVGSETSGDYYQAFETPRGPLVILADLMGQGLAAAMIVAQLQHKIAGLAEQQKSLSEIATELNAHIWEKFQGTQKMTCVLARWEGAKLHYVNAGHLPTLHLSKREVFTVPVNNAAALGADENITFTENELEFQKGDMLLLYTDGAYAGLAADRENGAREIERMTNEFNSGEVNTLCHRIFDCGQPEYFRVLDDSTVVVVRRQEYVGE